MSSESEDPEVTFRPVAMEELTEEMESASIEDPGGATDSEVEGLMARNETTVPPHRSHSPLQRFFRM